MENIYRVEVGNLLALCYIYDDFLLFENNLRKIIRHKFNLSFIHKLDDFVAGKLCFGASKERKFYEENKKVIDLINIYSFLGNFIVVFGYDENGNRKEILDYFYKYITKNKENKDKIISVLEKIQELGFYSIEFNPEFDFTGNLYDVDSFLSYTYNFSYVDNIEIVPMYTDAPYYKTSGSNYELPLNLCREIVSRDSGYGKSVKLNSLVFDVDRLPNSLNREDTYDKILELYRLQSDKLSLIRNSVNLDISISDLDKQFKWAERVIGGLDKVSGKEQLLESLLKIRTEIENLRLISKQYNESVSQVEPSITLETLANEKRKYLRRREMMNIDID